MIYIYVVLLINNHILVGYQNEPINGIKDINDITPFSLKNGTLRTIKK